MRRFGQFPLTAGSVVFGFSPFRQGALPFIFQFFGRASAVVSLALLEELFYHPAMDIHTLGLEKWPLIPVQAEPCHGIKNRPRGLLCGAKLVSVFDAQNESPPLVSGKKPVKKGRPGPANVQITCGRRSESRSNFLFF
jgi:hypothetical protein